MVGSGTLILDTPAKILALARPALQSAGGAIAGHRWRRA